MKKIIALSLLLHLSQAITFNCQFVDIDSCTYHCNQCKAVNMIITRANQTVTRIFGFNGNFSQVQVLKMHDQLVRSLPSDLDYFFPKLSILQIWSCGLRAIVQRDISPFTELLEISISKNELEVLPSNLFEKNPKILKIDFSRNRLKHVGFNLLQPLTSLMYADFYQNDCINEGNFNGLENLVRKLRRKCLLADMLIDDVRSLSERVDTLETELMTCEKIHRNRRCDSERKGIVALDTLFPSIFIRGDGNDIDKD